MDAHPPERISAPLKTFLDSHGDPCKGGSGLSDDLHKAVQRIAACEKIVHYKDPVIRKEKLGRNDYVIVVSVSE